MSLMAESQSSLAFLPTSHEVVVQVWQNLVPESPRHHHSLSPFPLTLHFRVLTWQLTMVLQSWPQITELSPSQDGVGGMFNHPPLYGTLSAMWLSGHLCYAHQCPSIGCAESAPFMSLWYVVGLSKNPGVNGGAGMGNSWPLLTTAASPLAMRIAVHWRRKLGR